jgi:hypothetical protein
MALDLTIDLKTRFIPENNRVFIVFPGEGYRYYQTMESASAVFLDLPGFPVPKDRPISTADDLVKRVVVSDLFREWHRKGALIKDMPSRDPVNIQHFRMTKRRQQLGGMVENLFARLKRGDVVVVPPRALEDEVLYGEIDSDPDEVTLVSDPNRMGELIPARRVKWIARQPRMTVPGWLERKLPNQNPIRQIEKTLHKYIYDYMYERYFFDGQFVCKFKIDTPHFSSLDDFFDSADLPLHHRALRREKRRKTQGAARAVCVDGRLPDRVLRRYSRPACFHKFSWKYILLREELGTIDCRCPYNYVCHSRPRRVWSQY